MAAAIKFPMGDRCLMCGHSLIGGKPAPRRVDVHLILGQVAKVFSVTVDQLKGPIRTMHIAAARQVAMYLMYEHGLNVSYPGIARVLGRNHSTIIHGHNLIAKKIKASKAYRQTIESIRQDIWLAAA